MEGNGSIWAKPGSRYPGRDLMWSRSLVTPLSRVSLVSAQTPVLAIPTGPPVRGRQLWRRTGNFLLIFLQFYVCDLRFKPWGPATFFYWVSNTDKLHLLWQLVVPVGSKRDAVVFLTVWNQISLSCVNRDGVLDQMADQWHRPQSEGRSLGWCLHFSALATAYPQVMVMNPLTSQDAMSHRANAISSCPYHLHLIWSA